METMKSDFVRTVNCHLCPLMDYELGICGPAITAHSRFTDVPQSFSSNKYDSLMNGERVCENSKQECFFMLLFTRTLMFM